MIFSLLLGCSPHDADVSATYLAFFEDNSSDALTKLRLEDKFDKQKDLVPVDCRHLREGEVRLEGASDACDTTDAIWFPWLKDYGYYRKEGTVSTDDAIWRAEAVLTSEGDLQLTVHADMEDFGDFRFGWSIKPDFQPTVCDDSDADGVNDGTAALTNVDGNWLENWSANDPGYTVWHLNSGSYQRNPSNLEDYWFFTSDWEAGTSFARFGEEVVYHHPADYEHYSTSVGDGPLYFPRAQSGASDLGDLPAADGTIDDWASSISTYLTENDDLAVLGGAEKFKANYRVHSNAWRPDEGLERGLNNWVEVPFGYVRLKDFTPGDAIEAGDANISGDFQMYLGGQETASRLYVSGTFTINHITQIDNFSPTLEDIKQEENSTPACK